MSLVLMFGFIYIQDSSNSHFDLATLLLLALEATEVAVELINIHLISVQQKRYISVKAILTKQQSKGGRGYQSIFLPLHKAASWNNLDL